MTDDFIPAVARPEKIDEPALWFVFQGAKLLLFDVQDAARVPLAVDARELALEVVRQQYLGTLNGKHCFSAELDAAAALPGGTLALGLREVYGRVPDEQWALAARAVQVVDWDRSHRFCGACGAQTVVRANERARECPQCALVNYPRIAPAVMVLIRRGHEILLARSPHFPPGMYSALAGFVDAGESLEQTIAREVNEEVGIAVRNLRYFSSQSWPFPHSLMIAFNADYASGEIAPDPSEIEDAKWFSLDNLPPRLPGKISISRRLLDATLDEMRAV
jgi:NAD+ diphosphatase